MASDIITLQVSENSAIVKSMQGDSTSPSIITIFVDGAGTPINLTGLSPKLFVGSLFTIGTVINAAGGTVSFTITPDLTPANGEYPFSFDLLGAQITVPTLYFVVYDFAFGGFSLIIKSSSQLINADTLQGRPATDFATAVQGAKADSAVPQTRIIAGLDLSQDRNVTELISAGLGDMKKSAYDTDNDGIVDKANKLMGDDTRQTNNNPSFYYSKATISSEFKNNSVIGLADTGVPTFSQLTTFSPWTDSSGGYPFQIALNANGIYWRVGTSDTLWGAWNKLS